MNNFNVSYYVPILMVIVANVIYHLLSKNISAKVNPFLALSVTYGVSLIICLFIFAVTKTQDVVSEIKEVRLMNILLGIAVLGTESGYILMYRSGWQISKGSLSANICVAITLLIAGLFLYKEKLSVEKVLGLLFCVVGVYLINVNK